MQTAAGSASIGARVFAWGGAIVFVVSLSYFLYAYGVTFGEILPPEGGSHIRERNVASGFSRKDVFPIAIDVALFTLFALHHSVFARERVRAWVARVVPPSLERSVYVWVASLMFIGVCAWWQPVPGVLWRVTGPAQWLLLAAQAVGAGLAVASAASVDIFELSGVRQLSPRRRPIEFKTSGPYGWVRHPIYTGWFLVVFATPVMTGTRLVFAAISSLYLVVAIPFEERSLRATTGEAYARYARQVRWKLIPGVF